MDDAVAALRPGVPVSLDSRGDVRVGHEFTDPTLEQRTEQGGTPATGRCDRLDTLEAQADPALDDLAVAA